MPGTHAHTRVTRVTPAHTRVTRVTPAHTRVTQVTPLLTLVRCMAVAPPTAGCRQQLLFHLQLLLLDSCSSSSPTHRMPAAASSSCSTSNCCCACCCYSNCAPSALPLPPRLTACRLPPVSVPAGSKTSPGYRAPQINVTTTTTRPRHNLLPTLLLTAERDGLGADTLAEGARLGRIHVLAHHRLWRLGLRPSRLGTPSSFGFRVLG